MTDVRFQSILSCRTLPSLPAVALQVLELTRDPSASADKLASVIQGDPGLASKLLKTVNSSFYGLAQPCASIGKAVGLMGLNSVKSLALGFSLIDTASRATEGGFDLTTYWRRAVYSAAAARLLAKKLGTADAEEAFVAALLQDIGMLALRAAMKEEYDAVLSSAPPDHGDLCSHERDKIGFDHAEVGAALAHQWRLPAQLVDSTRLHHSEDPGDGPTAAFTRITQLSCLASLVIVADTGCQHLERFREQIGAAVGWSTEESDAFLSEVSNAGSQLSLLLKVNTGQKPDVANILAEAHERLAAQQEQMQQQTQALERQNTELTRKASTDALTGALNRRFFDEESVRLFEAARSAGTPLSIAFTDADKFKSVNDTHGHQAGDAVLIELARRLRSTIGERGLVCRYGGEEFAVLLPGVDSVAAKELGEAMRLAVEAMPVDIARLKLKVPSLPATISVGLATFDPKAAPVEYESVAALTHAADQSVYAAKSAGRNCVRSVGPVPAVAKTEPERTVTTPASSAPAIAVSTPGPIKPAEPAPSTVSGGASTGVAPTRSILLVEDDPLAAKLLEAVLARVNGVKMSWVRTAEEAESHLAKPGAARPDLAIVDLNGISDADIDGADFTRSLRSSTTMSNVPIAIISAADAPATAQRCLAAGADAFFPKRVICADMSAWVKQVLGLIAGRPARASAAA